VYLTNFCGDRHLEFSIFGHISIVNEDIFVKFGRLTIGTFGALAIFKLL